jgi:hypothetical protein
MMMVARMVGVMVMIVAMMITVVVMMVLVMMIAVPRGGRHCAAGRQAGVVA